MKVSFGKETYEKRALLREAVGYFGILRMVATEYV